LVEKALDHLIFSLNSVNIRILLVSFIFVASQIHLVTESWSKKGEKLASRVSELQA